MKIADVEFREMCERIVSMIYDVNMSIDYNCKSFLIFVLRIRQLG